MDVNNGYVRRIVAGLSSAGLVMSLCAADPLESVQQAAGEWAKVRAETVRLDSDWAWQKVLMESTRDALQERVKQLEQKRAALEAKTAGERREAEELTARRQEMVGEAAEAAKQLQELDARLVRMRPWLPPRLSVALELPYRSLAASALPLGERMQHTMAILNRCLHFNRTLTHGEEAIAVPGGEGRLLEVVYWGLSNGYALDRTAGTAYLGAPAAEGWVWTPAPELAADVGRLLAVCADKTAPEYVELALRVSDPTALNPQP